jgi:D-alanyl-D-alanine carboxypeptidase
VLFEKEADAELPIASLTKIMTALLVLEATGAGDVVTVSELAAAQPGSETGLVPGERIRVRQLMYGLLLQSGNDSAVALAEHVSGSVEEFVQDMNARAEELKLRGTEFASPSGLDDRGRSTARELATLTRYLYRVFPRDEADVSFPAVVRTKFHTIPAGAAPARHIQNRNVLLWLYPGAIGVKTGSTPGSGESVVAVAEREGRRLIAVVLGAPKDQFSPAAALLDYGFHAFEEDVLVAQGEEFQATDAAGTTLPVLAERGLYRLVPVGESPSVSEEVRLLVDDLAGARVGDRVAKLVLTVDGQASGGVPLVVSEIPAATPEPGPRAGQGPGSGGTPGWAYVAGGVALIVLAVAMAFRAFVRRRP